MKLRFIIAILCCLAGSSLAIAQDGPIPVEVIKTKQNGWELRRGGKPYFIKGGCIVRSTMEDPDLPVLLDAIRDAGGNCIRLWSTGPGTGGILDAAHERGLSVMLGLWMLHSDGHADSSGANFDYLDFDAVQDQIDTLAIQVELYKNHPALLAWGVGNEVEHLTEEADANQTVVTAIWRAINRTAAMVKSLDPEHPTIAVTAELGDWHLVDNATQLSTYCPNIDIWGVNAYETLPEIRAKIDESDWDRPYLIPEYGPSGWWNAIRTTWGGRYEHTTDDKATFYRDGWNGSITGESDRCLGGFAYLWDELYPPTDTWFMMFGPAMEPSPCVDAMIEAWTGSPPANLSPSVTAITGVSGQSFDPADPLTMTVEATDPEGGELLVDWIIGEEIFDEDGVYRWNSIGPCNYVESGGGLTLEMTAPLIPGAYRVVAIVHDDAGRIGVASSPFFVDGDLPDGRQPMPFRIDNQYSTTGFMGAYWALDLAGIESPNGACAGIGHRFTFDPPPIALWAGVAWQYPANNWGTLPGLPVAPGGESVQFLAWSDKPGTVVDFFVGSADADGFEVRLDGLELTTEPTYYDIPLQGIVYDEVTIPFGWVISQTAGETEPRDILIADLTWIGPPPPPPCDPDLSGDRKVNGRDLGILINRWYATGEQAGDADLNEDGFVDNQDLILMLEAWGECPENP
ncbi:MAG: hypothetical protein CMJ67_05460 [Planctomycetaceae bacterium]|nr:hypothetical protein [Planctomycetaceae bacterium]